jgi:hypothetical protein
MAPLPTRCASGGNLVRVDTALRRSGGEYELTDRALCPPYDRHDLTTDNLASAASAVR